MATRRANFVKRRSFFYSSSSRILLSEEAGLPGAKSAHRLPVGRVILQCFARIRITPTIPALSKYQSMALQAFLGRAVRAPCDRLDCYFARSNYLGSPDSCFLSLPWLVLRPGGASDLFLASAPCCSSPARELIHYRCVTQSRPRSHWKARKCLLSQPVLPRFRTYRCPEENSNLHPSGLSQALGCCCC